MYQPLTKKFRIIAVLLTFALMFNALIPLNTFAGEIPNPNLQPPVLDQPQTSEGKIIGELTEKREQNIKHFLKDDMTYEADIYPFAVHYFEDGKWKDIDNTLVDNKDEENNDVLENVHNDFKIKIAKNSQSNKLVRIQKGNYELSWNLEASQSSVMNKVAPDLTQYNLLSDDEKKKAVLKNFSEVNFSNILPDTDLNYLINGNSVKENIVINKVPENPIYTFNLSTKKLVPVLQKDNSIIFFDEADSSKGILKIPAPFMYDAKHAESQDIEVTLNKTNSGYSLSLKPNQDWLKSAGRSFPVDGPGPALSMTTMATQSLFTMT